MKTLTLILKMIPYVCKFCKALEESVKDGKLTEDECKDITSQMVEIGYEVVNLVKGRVNKDE